jgi:hypothetical protein
MRVLRVIGAKGPDLGIAAIEIDGGSPVLFDCYDVHPRTSVILYTASIGDSPVAVNVYANGTKNAASTGFAIIIDDPAQISGAPVGSLTAFALTSLTDHVRGVAAYSRPATVYLRLFSGGTELSGNNYAALAITNNTTNFPAAAGRTKALAGIQVFLPPTGASWTFDEVRCYDAAVAGNALATHSLSSPVTVTVGNEYVFDGTGGSEFIITCPAEGIVDAELHAILDHMFGGGDYTAKATTYGAYYAGDPQGAGAQAGGRVAITNDGTQWSAASGGLTRSLADITLTAQATATHWSEWDAAVAGNLLWSTTLPEVPKLDTIPAGKLRFKLY